jgi:hypothetical protein
MTATTSITPSTAARIVLPRLHPWWTQVWLQGRRSFDTYRLAAGAALAGATLVASAVLARDAAAANLLFEHRQLAAIVVAALLLFSLRLAVANAARSLRYGWMAALPLPPHAGRRTLLVATLVIGVLAIAWLALGLAGLGVSLGMSAFARMLANLLVGVVAGCLGLAWVAHRSWQRPAAMPVRVGIRVPLLSLAWLEVEQLPFLVAWQNRECTRRWRTSGGAKPVALVLLLFPGSESPGIFFGLIAGALVIAWHRCLIQSSLEVTERAASLARRWPLSGTAVKRALLRFPLAGSALAFVALFAAVALTMQPPLAAAVASALALALASPLTLARLAARMRSFER